MSAYYNENDKFAAVWLRNLIRQGVIEAGEVDERDIADVRPEDLIGFKRCHFFAGIGGWALALSRAQWRDDRECWTGSCPCQGHSSAPRGRQTAPDQWPHLGRLVVARSPRVLFGEQVATAGDWFDGVCDDLEALDYEVGAAILPACGVGLDHQRARIYFVGHAHRHSEPERAVDAEVDWLSRYRGQPTGVAAADGISVDMGEMRAYGNAVVVPLATAFIEAYMSLDR